MGENIAFTENLDCMIICDIIVVKHIHNQCPFIILARVNNDKHHFVINFIIQ